jgi:hypothetical protein
LVRFADYPFSPFLPFPPVSIFSAFYRLQKMTAKHNDLMTAQPYD